MQLIDVRSPGEFAAGHVPKASNIPLEQVESRLKDLANHGEVVLICQSGGRAAICFENFSHVRQNLTVLDGGTEAWVKEGGEVVKSQTSSWSIERQVRLTAGMLILLGTILSLTLAPGWIYLAMFVGAGLTFAGLTNTCGMASLFALMPWNRAKSCETNFSTPEKA